MADIPKLPQNVMSLVIAAREAFDTGMLPDDEQAALDKALEPFASAVPCENEPTRADPPDDLAKRLFWADVLLGNNPERLQPEWRDRWWDEMSTMPLSGPGFLRKWRALADAALSTLSADAIRQGEGRK